MAKIGSSTADMREAIKRATDRERSATKIVAASYHGKDDVIAIELSTGAELTVPRSLIPGFADATPAMLRELEITPGSEGLWSEAADDGVLLEQLLIAAAGAPMLGSIGARINAAKTSTARAAASRANGAKGGRPRSKAG